MKTIKSNLSKLETQLKQWGEKLETLVAENEKKKRQAHCGIQGGVSKTHFWTKD